MLLCEVHSSTIFLVDGSYGQCSQGETCRPTVQCSAQFPNTEDLKEHTCQLNDLSPGICCKDITKSWGSFSLRTVQKSGTGFDTRSFTPFFDAR